MKTMVRAIAVLGLASLPLARGPAGGGTRAAVEKGAGGATSSARTRPPAPPFSEKDVFGKRTVALERYRGKVVVLNFWATWCGPCKEEIPALVAIQASHQGKVEVIGVSVFSSDGDITRYYKDHGLNYPVFDGSFELMDAYDRVRTIPTTFLIDKKGALAAKVVGARTREQYEALLQPLLDE